MSNGHFCSIASVGTQGYQIKLHLVLFSDEGFQHFRYIIVHDVLSWNDVNNVELLHERCISSQHRHMFFALHGIQ